MFLNFMIHITNQMYSCMIRWKTYSYNGFTKKNKDLQKGVVCEFIFDQHKAPLSKKVSEYLEKEIDMNVIYQFELKSLELIDIGSNETADNDSEE